MADYKERMINAKRIFDERNPNKKQNKKEVTTGAKRIQRANNRALAQKLATDYFRANQKQLVDNTLEHFIFCMENEKGKDVFWKCYDMDIEKFPEELHVLYEHAFLATLAGLTKEHLINKAADFCQFYIEFDESSANTYKGESSSKFKFWIKIIMYING